MPLTDAELDRMAADPAGDPEMKALLAMYRGESAFRGYPVTASDTGSTTPASTPRQRTGLVSALFRLLRRLSGR